MKEKDESEKIVIEALPKVGKRLDPAIGLNGSADHCRPFVTNVFTIPPY